MNLKLSRFSQWLDVLREESRDLGPLDLAVMAWHIIKAATGLGVTRALWRSRIATCYRCPIYDRQMRRCRPQTGHDLGCGCWTPALAMSKQNNCWGKRFIPGFKFGWNK